MSKIPLKVNELEGMIMESKTKRVLNTGKIILIGNFFSVQAKMFLFS